MTPGRPRRGDSSSRKAPLREPDGAAGSDFAWPPPADDPATCSMVSLKADTEPRPRLRTTMPEDAPMEWFPEIDIETALDAFADPPATPTLPAAARPAVPHGLPWAPPPASWWAAGMRSVVAFCIGVSLALMPASGLPPARGTRPLDVPAASTPRAAAPLGIGTPVERRAAPKPVAEPSPGKAGQRDEEHIRTTLAELRTAYSQLDAGAAREVWPSVDVDALARAFDGLKSQELRFDSCDVTVDGAHARAACTGEAVYVPRVGGAAFSSAARAWTFELTRLRERWMIASARAS